MHFCLKHQHNARFFLPKIKNLDFENLGHKGVTRDRNYPLSPLLIHTKSNRITKNIPPKGVIFSDFMLIFAMPLMILLVFKRSTK